MTKISPLSLVRNQENEASSPSIEALRARVQTAVSNAITLVETQGSTGELSYREAERALRDAVFGIGRALVVLLFGLREQHVMSAHRSEHAGRWEWLGRRYRAAPPIARTSRRCSA